MTGADVASIMNATNRDGFLEGNGIIILILFFLIFGFGGNFGANGNGLTQSELQMGLYNQTTDRNLSDIRDAIALTNQNVSTTGCGISKEILQSRYDAALASANSNSMLQSCCCELKTAIHSEGEETRALITANRISELEKELTNANTIISNQVQTQNILNSLGNFYPKSGVNPYAVYGYGYNGTTIY